MVNRSYPDHDAPVVPFLIPLSFAERNVDLHAKDVIWAAKRGWLGATDVVTFALHHFETAPALQPIALAYDELSRVPWLIDAAEQDLPPDAQCEKVWLFLATAFVVMNGEPTADGGLLDTVVAHFGYPTSARGLLSFAPVSHEGAAWWQPALAQLRAEAARDSGPGERLEPSQGDPSARPG